MEQTVEEAIFLQKKMVGIARFDKEQSDAEREQHRPPVEQRKATPIKNHRHADHGGRTKR